MSVKYRVIERFRGKYPIEAMCECFDVSRSGYYKWRLRQKQPKKDERLKALIRQGQQESNQTYGVGRMQLWLDKQGYHVNRKAIYRVMRENGLLAQIRRRRVYTYYKQTAYKYSNLLARAFRQSQPNLFWATDITYIPTPGGMLYMCAVIDLCGGMVLSWRIGTEMTASLVTDTVQAALKQEKVTGGLALHSDQGSQYTSTAYHDLSEAYHFSPSMSSPGCPYDNAAMENFFGTLKVECLYRKHFSTRNEVELLVSTYIYFYNFQRIHLKDGLTPFEIRSKAA